MKCPQCGVNNLEGSLRCHSCGIALHGTDYPSTLYNDQDKPGTPESTNLQEQISHISELLTSINKRLTRLEQMQGIPAPEPEKAVPLAAEIPVIAQAVEPPIFETPPVLEPVAAAIPESTPEPIPEPEIVVPRKPREWEQVFGGNWLARIGVIALIIGIAFFIKFTIDNAWMDPTIRAIAISIPGFLLIGAGLYWRKRFPTFSQALNGGGIAVLYLAVFAAFAVFQILNIYIAVILLFLVSGGCAALALTQNSMALAIISVLGAFAGSYIVGVPGKPAGDAPLLAGTNITLLVYVMLVDLGVIALAAFRNWRWFTLLALFGTMMEFGIWYNQFGTKAPLWICEGGLTILFLIFVGATTLYHFIWNKIPKHFDYVLMAFTAIAYYTTSYSMMWREMDDWMGLFTLLLALFYGGFTYAAWHRNRENTTLRYFLLTIAIVFLTLAIPVQLGDRAWTTIAWAAEGTVLMWLAIKFKMNPFRYYSYAVFIIAAVRLLIFDTRLNMMAYQPVLNERVLAFVFGIAALGLTGYLLWREQQTLAIEKKPLSIYPAFLVTANILSMWIVAVENISYKASFNSPLIIIFTLFMAAVVTLYHLAWRRQMQAFDYVMLVINTLFYLFVGAALWNNFRPWMGLYYLVPALCYGLLAYFTLFTGRVQGRTFGLFSAVIALVFLTVAVPVQFENRIWTTIAWAVEFALLVWLSFPLKLALCRYFSYVVFGLMAIRLLFFDTAIDLRVINPIINERSLVFLVAIAIIYLVVFLILWRKREVLNNWVALVSALLVAANFYTLWALSFSIWDYFGRQISLEAAAADKTALMNAQKFSLTALWALYAVILLVLGFMKRWRLLRLWALGLLMVAIIKVFTYDVWTLEEIYRIGAFVGLGFLLLLSAYLYQRYSRRIRTFIVPVKKEVAQPQPQVQAQIKEKVQVQVQQQPFMAAEARTVPVARSKKPVIAGILSIFAGSCPLIISIVIVATGSISQKEIVGVIILLTVWCMVGGMAIAGGILAILRKRWGLALTGAICAAVCCFPIPIVFIGIAAIVLLVIAKKEFGGKYK